MKQKLELYKEYPEPDEAEIAQKIVSLMEGQMVKNFPTGRTLRDVHSKGHGCVKAEFIVEPGLPDELRVGVFKEARGFPAWIRFSNAGGLAPVGGTEKDSKPDARGMAIKLLGVEGPKILEQEKDAQTQDFLLFTPNTFFTAGPEAFYDLMVALTTSKLHLLWFMITHPCVTFTLFLSLKKQADLLELQYFSAVPYLFGSKAVKYSAKPQSTGTSKFPDDPSDDFLRERLAKRLTEEEAGFDFMIQFQTDPRKMPIENALVPWKEKLSPFIKVASIRIPRQSFDSPAQLEYCDDLSFTPWHCLPEHRPLGSVSRVRRVVYDTISTFRHNRNDVPRQEPTVDSFRQFSELAQ